MAPVVQGRFAAGLAARAVLARSTPAGDSLAPERSLSRQLYNSVIVRRGTSASASLRVASSSTARPDITPSYFFGSEGWCRLEDSNP